MESDSETGDVWPDPKRRRSRRRRWYLLAAIPVMLLTLMVFAAATLPHGCTLEGIIPEPETGVSFNLAPLLGYRLITLGDAHVAMPVRVRASVRERYASLRFAKPKPSTSCTWREGYYEGETEDRERVLFLVPSKTNVIARFQVVLNVLETSSTEEDEASGLGFEARDVRIENGAFRHSSVQHGLFALHGGLGPDGKAHGRCIGVVNGWANHRDWGTDFHFGSSQWTRWEAAWKTTEDDPNAPLFVPRDC